MHRRAWGVLLVAFLFSGSARAALHDIEAAPIPPPPSVPAKSFILIDHHSGEVIAERDADRLTEPASITKIMTAYVAFHALRKKQVSLDDEVLVSDRAWRMGGSRMYIRGGQRVRFEDLLRGAIIRSGNDAAVAIAEHVGGSVDAFVETMNAEAQRLGMPNTHFTSPSGLTRHKESTSARDIATLSRAVIREFPEHYHLFGEKSFRYSKYFLRNRNKLLADASVDGIKTGYTVPAGYCLAASAKEGHARFIAVVMGAKTWRTRNAATQALLDYGKRHFETLKLYEGGTPLVKRRVWKGSLERVSVGLRDDLLITLPKGHAERLRATMDVKLNLYAPLKAGDKLGQIRIRLDDKEIQTRPVIALKTVAEGSIWRQMVDTLTLWFEGKPTGASAPQDHREVSDRQDRLARGEAVPAT